jgi:hypothetical protein
MKKAIKNIAILAIIAIATFTASNLSAQSTIRAKRYALQMSESLMRQINPMTGTNAQYSIQDADYDPNTGEYLIELNAYWSGRTWALGDDTTFEIRGFLTVDRNGQMTFKETYRNRAVSAAVSNGRWATGAVVLTLAAAASSGN